MKVGNEVLKGIRGSLFSDFRESGRCVFKFELVVSSYSMLRRARSRINGTVIAVYSKGSELMVK